MLHRTLFLGCLLVGLSCSEQQNPSNKLLPLAGSWLLSLDLNGHTLPVNMFIKMNNDDADVVFVNGDEHILVEDVRLFGDSIEVTMPLYDSKFIGLLSAPDKMAGYWVNLVRGSNYRVPFEAQAGERPRFPKDDDGVFDNLGGRWEVSFFTKSDTTKAVGLFEQKGDHLSGTFLTETGDYRYLEGGVVDDRLYLSCFDGSHAFLFTGKLRNDSIVNGEFLSGTHWVEGWVAARNPNYELTDPDSLTALKEGYDMVDFSIADLDGNLISPKDKKFQNKVLMVQIMGSWCPNCMDETALFSQLYKDLNPKGLEIVALAFEKGHDTPQARERILRMKKFYGVEYDVLIAGPASKTKAAETLPFLNHIISYPTCIFIDRGGVVRKIHTGFYGPGTGEHYTRFVEQLEVFLVELLAESPPKKNS